MSWGVSTWVCPVWDSRGFLDLCNYFLPHFGEVFSYYLLEYFLMAFIFVLFFWDSYDSNVGAFHIVPEVPEVVLISFDSFFFFPFCFIYFHYFIFSTSLILSSASIILLLVPCRVFLISFIALIIFIDFFLVLLVLVKHFLHLFNPVSKLFICNSILFSIFWIISFIIILNCFSGRFPISSSFVWLGGHFSCFFTCCVFLCLFILFRLLCLEWDFCILVVCGSFLLWRFLSVGGAGRLACWGLLVMEACIGVLVGGVGFLLSPFEDNGLLFWVSDVLC